MSEKMKIVYLASEVYPFFKTGGLADVMEALPNKMEQLGHDVSIIMPKYDKIPLKYLEKIEFVDRIEINGEVFNLVKYPDKKINYLFIENSNYYERGRVYGDLDEDCQYSLFCEASLIFLKRQNIQADILHCNDWQTGPIPYFLKERYKRYDPFYWDMRVVYTIHNLMYQGKFNNYSFDKLGYYRDSDRLNFMELGLIYSDVINTVSPSYANEIKHPYFSEGLEWITSNKEIYGILNGINEDLFDPMKTRGVIPYNLENLENKSKNKEKLQDIFSLPKNSDLLIGMVSRFVEGKGLDLVSAKLEELLKYDRVQIIFLGTGSTNYENYYRYLESRYPDKFKAYIGYSEEIANLIYAGSDMFLMPSRYEPCGLSQMIAMRFGTIPLVREIGGLRDTVIPYDFTNDSGNGFSFTNFNADDMLNTIRFAEYVYYDKKEIWDKLVKRNMGINNSWDKSAKEYERLYEIAKQTP